MSYWERLKYKRDISRVRKGLKALGYDISSLTDKELEDGLVRLSHAAVLVGITTKEADQSFMKFSKKLLQTVKGKHK